MIIPLTEMDGPYYASVLTKLKRLLSTVNARRQATDDPFHAIALFPLVFFLLRGPGSELCDN